VDLQQKCAFAPAAPKEAANVRSGACCRVPGRSPAGRRASCPARRSCYWPRRLLYAETAEAGSRLWVKTGELGGAHRPRDRALGHGGADASTACCHASGSWPAVAVSSVVMARSGVCGRCVPIRPRVRQGEAAVSPRGVGPTIAILSPGRRVQRAKHAGLDACAAGRCTRSGAPVASAVFVGRARVCCRRIPPGARVCDTRTTGRCAQDRASPLHLVADNERIGVAPGRERDCPRDEGCHEQDGFH
jgi:hypothetical protein